MPMIPCDTGGYYYSLLISYAGLVPWAITGGIWIMHYLTGEGAFSLVSWIITFIMVPLYPAQQYFNDVRLDPFCSVISVWATPIVECCAVGSLLTFCIFFRWWYKVVRGWFPWLVIWILVLTPPIIHVGIAGTEWWKVLLSFVWGSGFVVAVCPIIWFGQNTFAYLFNLPVIWKWYGESILLRDEHSKKLFRTLRKRWLRQQEQDAQSTPSAGYSWALFSILSSKYGSTKSPSTTRPPLSSGTSAFTLSPTTSQNGARTLPSASSLLLPSYA